MTAQLARLLAVARGEADLLLVGGRVVDVLAGEVRGAGGAGGEVRARLPLPVAGLMSPEPLAAAREMGCGLRNPFMTLSFTALPVIPALRLTDRGLVDVARFAHVPLFA